MRSRLPKKVVWLVGPTRKGRQQSSSFSLSLSISPFVLPIIGPPRTALGERIHQPLETRSGPALWRRVVGAVWLRLVRTCVDVRVCTHKHTNTKTKTNTDALSHTRLSGTHFVHRWMVTFPGHHPPDSWGIDGHWHIDGVSRRRCASSSVRRVGHRTSETHPCAALVRLTNPTRIPLGAHTHVLLQASTHRKWKLSRSSSSRTCIQWAGGRRCAGDRTTYVFSFSPRWSLVRPPRSDGG